MGKIKSRFDTDTDRYRLLKIPKKIPNTDTDRKYRHRPSSNSKCVDVDEPPQYFFHSYAALRLWRHCSPCAEAGPELLDGGRGGRSSTEGTKGAGFGGKYPLPTGSGVWGLGSCAASPEKCKLGLHAEKVKLEHIFVTILHIFVAYLKAKLTPSRWRSPQSLPSPWISPWPCLVVWACHLSWLAWLKECR